MRLQIFCHRRDRDIDYPPRLLKGFFKGDFAEIDAQEFFQLAIVHDGFLAKHFPQGKSAPGMQIQPFTTKHRIQLAFITRAQQRGHHRTGARPGNHPWQQFVFAQGLDHPHVKHAHIGTARKHQGRASIALAGLAEEQHFLCVGQFRNIVIA